MARVHAKKSELGTETVNLSNNDNDIAKLFVKGKQSEGLLSMCKTALVDIKKGSAVGSYSFQRNPIIDKLIHSPGVLGAIVEKGDTEKKTKAEVKMTRAPALKSFDIRRKSITLLERTPLMHQQNKSHCVSCITLLSDERVLTCESGNALTMFDIKSNLQLSTIALSSTPWDACLVSRDKVVCTLPLGKSKNMQFICIGDTQLSLANSIRVAGDCYGVDCYEDKLFVCYGALKKIEAMTMDGKVVNEVSNKASERYLFNNLNSIKVHETGNSTFIYAADTGRFTITQLNLSLEILKTFENPNLKCPSDLEVVDSTQLLVCGRESNTIVVLNTSTGSMTTLLERIGTPLSVCFDQNKRKLFVGAANLYNSNHFLEYDIK